MVGQSKVQKNLTFEVEDLPPFEHNRMLRCWVKREKNDATAQTAIYTPMSDRRHTISPVVIDSDPPDILSTAERAEAESDLKAAVNLFHAYRLSAKAEAEEKKSPLPQAWKKKSLFKDERSGISEVWRQSKTYCISIRKLVWRFPNGRHVYVIIILTANTIGI